MATTFLNQTYKVNLLIKEKVKMISKLTSDPKRALETILQYLGIQTKHQHMIGISWFMKQMLRVNNFPHDMQVLARKIVYGYRWRKEETFNSKIKHQCKSIVVTRQKMLEEEFKKLHKENLRSICVLDKMNHELK